MELELGSIMAQGFSVLDRSLVMKAKQTENQVQKFIIHCNFYIYLLSLHNLMNER